MKKIITFNLYKENRRINQYKDIKCLYTNKTYTLLLDDVKTSINQDLLIRENNEFKFTLNIKDKTAFYLLKEKNMTFSIKVEKITSKFDKSNLILEYKLESDEENTKIEIIEKEDINE